MKTVQGMYDGHSLYKLVSMSEDILEGMGMDCWIAEEEYRIDLNGQTLTIKFVTSDDKLELRYMFKGKPWVVTLPLGTNKDVVVSRIEKAFIDLFHVTEE